MQAPNLTIVQESVPVLGRTSVSAGPQTPVEPVAPAQPTVRLVIEEDAASGDFVYKTLDSSTGEVVNQFPREEVLKMKQQTDYQSGAVVDTSA